MTAIVAVLGLIGVGAGVGAWQYFGCTETVALKVVAAPEIAGAVQEIADTLDDGRDVTFRGPCIETVVKPSAPDEVTSALAAGEPAPVGDPDVWIPDSTLWVGQARSSARGEAILDQETSIAESPVVLAMIRPAAEQLGWPDQQPSWEQILETIGSSTVKVGLADPTKSAASMLTLTGVGGVLGERPDAQLLLVQTIRALTSRLSATTDDVLSKLPKTPEQIQQTSLSLVGAFPFSEQGVFAYNQRDPGVPLAAIYPADGSPVLDYPFVPIVTDDRAVRGATAELLDQLRTRTGRQILMDAGFRVSGGEAGIETVAANGVLPDSPRALPTPDPTVIQEMRGLWTAASLNARILTVLDVSGSMGETVPDTDDRTRMDLTKESILRALPQLREDTSVGFWVFSTRLEGEKDYREVVPMRALGDVVDGKSQRNLLTEQITGIQPTTGWTGLYDTTLAAYQKLTAEYQPGSLNIVVVMTDGQNDECPDGCTGISRDQLLAEIEKLYDPERPVTIVAVSFGPDVDATELAAVSEATGGTAHVTDDPRQITQVILQAIVDQARTATR